MLTRHQALDVLVVGAGPVGLLGAIQLAQKDLRIQIIDEESRRSAHSYALALHPRSLKILESVGLAPDILRLGSRVDNIVLYDGAEPCAEIHLGDLPADFPYIVVLRQDVLEHVLEQRLHQVGLKVNWNHSAAGIRHEDDHVSVTVERWGKSSVGYSVATEEWVIERTRDVQASMVLAADGHRSEIRSALDIPYESLGTPEFYAVFEFECTGGPGGQMRIILDGFGTSVLWPLPGGYYRWSFPLRGVDVPPRSRTKGRVAVQVGDEAFPYLGRDGLLKFISERAPWFTGQVGQINWSIAVRFERRLAGSFAAGRCFLAGDAAHMANPVGVHSMNIGLREASDAATALHGILRQGASTGLLSEYDRRYRFEWRQLMGIDGLPVAIDDAPPAIRQNAARILSCIPASGEDLTQLAKQIGISVQP